MPQHVPYIRESYAPGPVQVDRDKGIVYGVRVCGPKSLNGHVYPPEVLRTSAKIYEGRAVNLNHHKDLSADVPLTARFGRLQNVHFADDGLNGDLRFNPKHKFAEEFCWACENMPDLYSFSHLARVQWRPQPDANGNRVAEAIVEVRSVDLVADAGTTTTVFESANQPGASTVTDPKAIATEFPDAAGMTTFLMGVMAASALTAADKMTIVESLMAELEPGDADTAEPTDAEMAAVAESVSRRGRNGRRAARVVRTVVAERGRAKARAWADGLMTSEGLRPDLRSELFTGLVAESFGNESRAKELIAERKRIAAPAGSGTGTPSTSTPGTGTPKSIKDIIADYAAG